MSLPLFWIRSNNFGDALNPVLYEFITGRLPVFGDPEKDQTILACGSLAHVARSNSVIWGTGAMADDLPPEHCNSKTTALAVRGPLTAWMFRKQGVDVRKTVFADPAILLPRYITSAPEIGRRPVVIPHYADCEQVLQLDWPHDFPVLSPMTDIMRLVPAIAQAKVVITSSLHALIVAEAYETPAIWVEFSDRVRGNGFKFYDYYLSTLRHPPEPIQIRNKQVPLEELEYAFLHWQMPRVNFSTLGDALLEVCPFNL